MKTTRNTLLLAAVVLCAAASAASAQLPSAPGDSPGWRGADRTGVSTEKGLLQEWPKGGPKFVWKIKGLGDGYSTPSVAGGKIFVMGTKGKEERVIALSVKDGSQLWSTPIGAESGFAYPGPSCTPTVDGEFVYAISSDGKIACLDSAKGTVKWKKDMKANLGGSGGVFGYRESPLIDGELVICTPGGDRNALVALNKTTGDVKWKAAVNGLSLAGRTGGGMGPGGGFPGLPGARGPGAGPAGPGGRGAGGAPALPGGRGRGGAPAGPGGMAGMASLPYSSAAYSSVVVGEVEGVRQYIQFLNGGVVGVSAADGKLLWHYDHPTTGMANCSTPIFHDGSVFAASAYNAGGGLARIKKSGDSFKAEEVYFVSKMQNQHGGVVLVGDYLYGTNETTLLCMNFKTGKIAWQERSVGKGSIAAADGCLYLRSEKGAVALVEANPTAYTEKGRFTQPDRSRQETWPYPVIAGGKLYLRDWDTLFCYDVSAK